MQLSAGEILTVVSIAAGALIWLARLESSGKRSQERFDDFVQQYRIDQQRIERDFDIVSRLDRLQRSVDAEKVVKVREDI